MKSRKTLFALCAIVTVCMLTVSMFSGCTASPTPAASAQPTQAPAASATAEATAAPTAAAVDNSPKGDPITFTMFYGYEQPVEYPADNALFKWMTDQTGITLNVEYLVGDINTKIGVYLASGDYPDFLWGHEVHSKFVDAGACVPLNDYIDKFGDNVKKAYSADDLKALTQPDGKIYYLSCNRSFQTNSYSVGGFYVQRRVLADAGYPKVTTLDQYFKLLTDYAAKNPETNGKKTLAYSLIADSSNLGNVIMPMTIGAGYPDDGYTVQINQQTYQANMIGNTDGAKKYMQALNDIYLKGLMDPEAFTCNMDQWNAKLSTGSVLGCFNWWWQIPPAQDALKQQKLDDEVFVAVPATWDPAHPSMLQKAMAESVRDGTSISIKCKAPDRAFKFMNWILSDEVQKRTNWGVQGTDYTVDSNGLFTRTADQRKQAADADYKKSSGLGALGYPFPVLHPDGTYADGNTVAPEFQQSEITATYDNNDLKILNAYGVKQYGLMFPQYAPLKYGVAWDITYPDGSDAQIAEQKVYDLMLAWIPKLAMAPEGKFDDVWNQYIAEFNKTNFQSVEKFITEQIAKRVGN